MRIDKLTIAAAFAATLLLGGCATLPSGSKPDPRDRFERANRSVYAFNRAVDHAILRPVARGYVKVTPKPVRRGISNFLANIDYPITILNDALQGKVHDGLSDIARFGINTVVVTKGGGNTGISFAIPTRFAEPILTRLATERVGGPTAP